MGEREVEEQVLTYFLTSICPDATTTAIEL